MYKSWYIHLSFFLLSLNLLSCGTLDSRYQVMSIVTTEPGVKLYKLDDFVDEVTKENCLKGTECRVQKIGETPLFFRGERAFNLNLLLEKDGLRYIHTQPAHLRWKEALIPDMVLVATLSLLSVPGAVVGFLGVAADLILGGGFEYPSRIVLNFPDKYNDKYLSLNKDYMDMNQETENETETETEVEEEGIYLVFPLKAHDKNISLKYTKEWKELNKNKLASEYTSFSFVNQEFVYQRLDMYGFDVENELKLSSFSDDQLMELGYLTNATHFVFLNRNDTYIGARIINTHTLQEDYIEQKTSSLVLTDQQVEDIQVDLFYHKLRNYLPNSITWSTSSDVLRGYELVDPYDMMRDNVVYGKEDVVDNISTFEHFIYGFSLSRVDHSKKYSAPDFGFPIYLSLQMFSYDLTYYYRVLEDYNQPPTVRDGYYDRRVDGQLQQSTRAKNFTLVCWNNLGPVFYSSVGAFSIRLSIGLAYEKIKIEDLYNDSHLGLAYGFNVGWNEFIFQNMFVFTEYQLAWTDDESLEKYLSESWPMSLGYFRIGVGYYLGDKLKALADNFF